MATKETKTGKETNNKASTNTRKSTAGTNKSNNNSVTRKQAQTGDDRTMKIIVGLIFIVLGVFLFAAVQFQAAGQLGNIIGNFMKGTMGLIGIIFPFYLIFIGLLMIFDKTIRFSTYSLVVSLIIILMLCILNSGRFIDPSNIYFNAKGFYNTGVDLKSGGLFGMGFGMFLVKYLGKIGLYSIGIGATVISILLLLKNTPAKKLINQIRIKSQERRIRKDEEKLQRAKDKEERELEKEKIKENQQKIHEIKEEQKRKREEIKERNRNDRGETHEGSGSFLDNLTLIPEGHNPWDDTVGLDNDNPRENRERIISVMNDDSNFDKRDYSTPVDIVEGGKGLGLESQRVVKPGYGLGDEGMGLNIPKDEYDSRRDGVTVIDSEKERKTKENPSSENIKRGGDSSKDNPASEKPAAPKADKITPKEARDATLDDSDFNKVKKPAKYKKPSIDLLKYVSNNTDLSKTNTALKEKADLLERTLKSFNVDAKVVQVTQGPAVTRYEIQPNVGVKVNKIVNLADDIALNLRARSIRIEAPIPGKAAVGIEVENDSVNMVTIREILDSREFKQSQSKISFGVGRDISGKAIIGDLKSMPHLLIAGSTGSGKSVCINGIITSILYKADPDEVKLVLIDPKVVELGDYNGIPHLLIPVVTEATKAAAALNWAVAEMTNRYKLFAENHVRDLEGYNEHLKAEGRKDETLPQVVIIIDELADLMMAAPSQVEDSICRLAQLARAAGMHLIVATQRPSVDVITGLIKANIPSRIAFAVASQFDSRTILDMGGAEKLVGKGDMLYSPLGIGKPIRVQGCFISDEEIHRVIDFVKNQQEAYYNDEVIETINRGNTQSGSDNATDDLFDEAVNFVIDAGKASTSLIQRRFRIGYNRAANIIDEMERRGIIGPADGSKPRQVYATAASQTDYVEEVDNSEADSQVENNDEDVSNDTESTYSSKDNFNSYSEDEEEVNEDIKALFDSLDSK